MIATLRAKVLPPGAGLLLLAAALMLFLVDPENRRAFLALPYGAAWLWIGCGRLARTGTIAALAGCALLIAGNVAEFWLVLVQSKPNANTAYQNGAKEVWIGSEIGWILFLLGFLILSIGLVLFGVAAVRADELPRWRALPLMVGVAGLTAFLFGPFLVAAADLLLTLIGVGWILLGYLLWSEKGTLVRGG